MVQTAQQPAHGVVMRLREGKGRVGGWRILIAEDELLVALELEDILAELRCEVVDVVSHVGGILPSAEEVDCALLDIKLKGRTSYDAALDLQRRRVPFAFVTGYTDPPDYPSALHDVPRLNKPFNKELLRALLGKLMDAKPGKAC